MTAEKIPLEAVPLFSSLPPDEMAFVRSSLLERHFAPGDALLDQGLAAAGIFVIRSGTAGASAAADSGGEVELATFGPGECVGEMSVVSGEPCSASIHAIAETDAWLITAEVFPEVVQRCPGVWRNLSLILRRRLAQTNRRLTETRAARVTDLVVLAPADTAWALAFAVGASLKRQTGAAVVLVDTSGTAGLSPARNGRRKTPAEADSYAGGQISAFEMLEDGAPRTLEGATTDRLLRESAHLIAVTTAGMPAASPAVKPAATVIVTDAANQDAALEIAAARSAAGQGRVDLAVLTRDLLTSENSVGGLWDRAAAAGRRAWRRKLGSTCPAVRVRYLPDDDGCLAAGPTPLPRGAFGSAVDSLARRVAGIEVGVALGAGLAKGFAHIGVLRAFEREGMPIDYLCGTSIGAIVASVYSGGMHLEQLERLMVGADKRFFRPTLPLRSLSGAGGLTKVLTECHPRAPTAEFPELLIPLSVVATDLTRGREVLLREGIVWRAVRASISMPGLFPPSVLGGRILVDGGLTNPIPAVTVRDMGADIAVGVDLTSPGRPTSASEPLAPRSRRSPRAPYIFETMWRTMEIMLGEITARSAGLADVTIRPRIGRSGVRDFSRKGPEFVVAGEEAASAALAEIRGLMATPSAPRAAAPSSDAPSPTL